MPAIVIQGKTYTLDDTERIFELIRGVTGCPVEEERRALYDICAMGPGEGRLVELGSFQGHSLCIMALASKLAGREKVISIDHNLRAIHGLWNTDFIHTEYACRSMRMALKCLSVEDWVSLISDRTDNAIEYLSDNLKVRVLHVDAAHDYDSALSDLTNYGPQVISGGHIVVHDIADEPVARAVDDFRKASKVEYGEDRIIMNSLIIVKGQDQ